jgi:hypothetical protein
MNTIDIAREQADAFERTAATWAQLRESALRDVVDTGTGIPLTVCAASYGQVDRDRYEHLDQDALVQFFQSLPYTEVTLSADGRRVPSGRDLRWHTGDATDDDWVYYERWTERGRVAHGWIHAATRRLLQSG